MKHGGPRLAHENEYRQEGGGPAEGEERHRAVAVPVSQPPAGERAASACRQEYRHGRASRHFRFVQDVDEVKGEEGIQPVKGE